MSDVPPPPPPPPPAPPPGYGAAPGPPPGFGAPPPAYGAPAYGAPAYGAPPPYGTPGNWQAGGTPFGPRAGFGARLGGFLLDGLFGLLLALPFAIPAIVLAVNAFEDCSTFERGDGTTELVCPPGAPDDGLLGLAILIGAAGALLVWLLFTGMLARSGQTWGRRIAGIKVVRVSDGRPPGWGRAIGRVLFASFISAQCCYLGYLWMLWDGEKRTWHDMVVGTRVVKA